jgi:hypothetical protein
MMNWRFVNLHGPRDWEIKRDFLVTYMEHWNTRFYLTSGGYFSGYS